ncbi:hypothetical protein K1719_043647 [Acacia pycnantha]|nr:hypothetical protein K1719_043647 [Acacia pycnantha]
MSIVKENRPRTEVVIVPKGSQQRSVQRERSKQEERMGTDMGNLTVPVSEYKGKGNGQILIWNCRGAASKGFAASLKNLNFVHKVDMVVLLETRISGNKAKKAIRSFGFKYSEIIEALGFVGVGMRMWGELWEKLDSIATTMIDPWLLAGDWNEISTCREQKGGGRVNEGRCRRFHDWIEGSRLIDLGVGPFFTWRGPKWSGHERVFKSLDRCLCNMGWQELFPDSMVKAGVRVSSDHHPLIINTCPESNMRRETTFRFEAAWLKHSDFRNFLLTKWVRRGDVCGNIRVIEGATWGVE